MNEFKKISLNMTETLYVIEVLNSYIDRKIRLSVVVKDFDDGDEDINTTIENLCVLRRRFESLLKEYQ